MVYPIFDHIAIIEADMSSGLSLPHLGFYVNIYEGLMLRQHTSSLDGQSSINVRHVVKECLPVQCPSKGQVF